MECDRCQTDDPSVGPWKDPGPYKRLCAKCKMLVTLTPERRVRLERELNAALSRLVPERYNAVRMETCGLCQTDSITAHRHGFVWEGIAS